MSTAGQVFSVTFIKRSTEQERTIVTRVGVKYNHRRRPMPYNPRDRKLIVVFDMAERRHKCVPIDGIEAVTFKAKRYRVD